MDVDFPMDLETLDTNPLMETESSVASGQNEEDPEVQKKYKMMLSMWLSFCVIGFIWFVTKVLKGRQRIRYNFSSIEEQLKRMQAVIEERERAMAERGITEGDENENNGNQGENVDKPVGNHEKISPDAQKLLETLTKAFGQSEELENVEECEETVTSEQENGEIKEKHVEIKEKHVEIKEKNEEIEEVNGNFCGDTERYEENEPTRRRKFIDVDPLSEDNVGLIRDTIEEIIQEGVKEAEEPSKKDI